MYKIYAHKGTFSNFLTQIERNLPYIWGN